MPFHFFGRVAVAVFLVVAGAAQAADDKPWTVSKSSGEVWTVTAGAQPVSLSQQAGLQPGDTIRTGRNGRVLLVRGEESILIAPNSAIGIPQRAADGMSTTIVQQAGSILLEVEKRNVQHFEVETPYLAAVVKGTQFRVSVGATGTSVNVLRGQVQVADFKSGQIAQVMPGQSATSFAQGKIGLALSGSGAFGPIEQGKPRPSAVERLMVPKNGLTAPRNAAAGTQVRTVGQITPAAAATRAAAASPAASPVASVTAARTAVAARPAATPSVTPGRPAGGIRIAAPIGDVRLNFNRVTNGLARGTTVPSSGRAVASRDTTIWTSRDGKPSSAASQGNSSDSGNPNGSSNAAATSPGIAAATAPVVAAGNSGSAGLGNASTTSNAGSNGNSSAANSGSSNNGRGNGATGNGNGTQVGDNSGRGNSGNNGNGNGNSGNNGNNGNGNNGNGNGNSGNNGNGNGRNR